MRQLLIDKYKGYYTVRYQRHAEAWSLKNLAMKSHGLISFSDSVFFNLNEAIIYATKIAKRMNLVNGTDKTGICVREHEKAPNQLIVDVVEQNPGQTDLDPVPNGEPNNWVRLKKES